jgi:hypothetical protein
VVLAEGSYKQGERGDRASKSLRFLIEESASIVVRLVSM